MQLAAWCGTASVAAASALAVTPITVTMVGPVRLTAGGSVLDTIQSAELGFNEGLINDEFGFNHGLLGAEQFLLGSAADQDDVVNRLITGALNMRVDLLEGTVNGLLGAHTEVTGATGETAGVSTLTRSLILGDPNALFNAGDLGGNRGIADQQAAAESLLIGHPSLQDLQQSEASQIAQVAGFHTELSDLSRLPEVENLFLAALQNSGDLGPGVSDGIERMFNVGNMELETFFSTLFGIGGVNPLDVASYADGGVSQLTSGLILGDPDAVFNGGDIGGLEGVFDQGLAALFDLAGL